MVVGFTIPDVLESIEANLRQLQPDGQDPESIAYRDFNFDECPYLPEDYEWTVVEMAILDFLMTKYRLFGVLKYQNMFFMRRRLSYILKKNVSDDLIWKYVQTKYPNHATLDLLEENPFDNMEESFLTIPEGRGFEEILPIVARELEERFGY